MRRIMVLTVVLTFGLSLASATRAEQGPPGQTATATFRICADANNLPYSNDKLEGFENKIATLFAKDLGATPTYTWWPDRRGFIRNTLRANQCDVAIVWGPLAGYFAKKAAVPLEVVVVPPLEGVPVPFTYEISMGVRKRDNARQEQLEALLRKHEAQIVSILQEYGVPLVGGPLVRRPDEAKRGVVSERYQ